MVDERGSDGTLLTAFATDLALAYAGAVAGAGIGAVLGMVVWPLVFPPPAGLRGLVALIGSVYWGAGLVSNVGVGGLLRLAGRRLPWATATVSLLVAVPTLWLATTIEGGFWFLPMASPALACAVTIFERR